MPDPCTPAGLERRRAVDRNWNAWNRGIYWTAYNWTKPQEFMHESCLHRHLTRFSALRCALRLPASRRPRL